MNVEQAKEYAKTMTYRQAISNVGSGKFIKYRKATMIKLRELTEIADRLDKADTPQTDCENCIWSVCNYNKVDWDADTPQTEELKCRNKSYYESCEYEDNCNPTVCFKALDEFQDAVTDCDHKCIQTEVGCERTDCP